MYVLQMDKLPWNCEPSLKHLAPENSYICCCDLCLIDSLDVCVHAISQD